MATERFWQSLVILNALLDHHCRETVVLLHFSDPTHCQRNKQLSQPTEMLPTDSCFRPLIKKKKKKSVLSMIFLHYFYQKRKAKMRM